MTREFDGMYRDRRHEKTSKTYVSTDEVLKRLCEYMDIDAQITHAEQLCQAIVIKAGGSAEWPCDLKDDAPLVAVIAAAALGDILSLRATLEESDARASAIHAYLLGRHVSEVVAMRYDPLVREARRYRQFVPTDLQYLLLELLDGRKMTQFDAMTELLIGSKETFNGKGGKGGMKELMEIGLVKNDPRRGGGYYRPDKSPEESVL